MYAVAKDLRDFEKCQRYKQFSLDIPERLSRILRPVDTYMIIN